MEKYSDYTDEELIGLYREGEEQIVEYLMEKYKNLVRSKATSMFIKTNEIHIAGRLLQEF